MVMPCRAATARRESYHVHCLRCGQPPLLAQPCGCRMLPHLVVDGRLVGAAVRRDVRHAAECSCQQRRLTLGAGHRRPTSSLQARVTPRRVKSACTQLRRTALPDCMHGGTHRIAAAGVHVWQGCCLWLSPSRPDVGVSPQRTGAPVFDGRRANTTLRTLSSSARRTQSNDCTFSCWLRFVLAILTYLCQVSQR